MLISIGNYGGNFYNDIKTLFHNEMDEFKRLVIDKHNREKKEKQEIKDKQEKLFNQREQEEIYNSLKKRK